MLVYFFVGEVIGDVVVVVVDGFEFWEVLFVDIVDFFWIVCLEWVV